MKKKHFTARRIIAAVLTLMLMGGFLPFIPGQVLGADYFTVTGINISKQYSSIEIPDIYYLTIKGTNLGAVTVSYLDSGGQLLTLTNPTGNDYINQYTINPERIGSTLYIGGPGGTKEFNIAETNMSKITSLNPKSIAVGESLIIEVANADELDGAEYKAYYYDQINQVEISSQLKGDTHITVNNTGLYNIRFERNFTGGPDNIPINISYRYLNIFRVYDELDGVSDWDAISMFPNRGEKGSTVYFRAEDLKQDMSVFFLKKDNGTDSFSQANKGTNYSYQKNAEGTVDIASVKIPSGLTAGEEYFVYFTNHILDTVDPMKYVFKQLKLNQKFMVINVGDKVQVFNVTPDSGPDTGQSIEITGRYLGSLNITGLAANSAIDDSAISFSADYLQAIIDYGNGIYSGEAVTGITKTIRVNVANSAAFEAARTQKASNFTLSADRIYVKTPTFPIADGQSTTYPVEIRTTTTFTKGGMNLVFEELTSYSDFTFIRSMIAPVVQSITPDKIQIEQMPDTTYAIKNDTLFAIYGQDFKIYRETLADGSAIVRYPIVRIMNGLNQELEINTKTGAEMYLFDASGNLLDGANAKQTGVKILIKIPAGIRVTKPVPDASPRSVRVVNPIKNGDGEGLSSTLEDKLYFVITDQTPVISSVTPDVVTVQGGEDITIKGGNFRTGVKVIIDGKEVSNINRDGIGETITFKAPAGRAGETQLQVLNPEGGMAVWPFTYVSTYTDPKLNSFSPAAGNTGTLVVVKGENFIMPDPTASPDEIYKLVGTRVLLGNQEINDYNRDAFNRIELVDYSNVFNHNVINDNGHLADYYHSVVFEDETVNKYYVLRQQADGTVRLTDGTDDNTYIITDVGGGLNAAKVNGGSFNLTVTDSALNLAGIELKMKTPYKVESGVITGNCCQVISSGEVRFVVPILTADGYYDLTVVNPDTKKVSKTGNQGFFYYSQPQSQPTITNINPAEGSTTGGYSIEINGSDFQDDGLEKTRVIINGMEVTAEDTSVSVDGKKITVIVPAYPGDLWEEEGTGRLTVPVVVLNPDGATASKEDGFTYVVPSSYPVITKIVPAEGSAAGGDIVEITGRDFRFYEPYVDSNRNQVWDSDETFSNVNNNASWDNFTGQTAAALHALYPDNYETIVTPVLPKVYFGNKQAVIQEFANGYLKVLTPAGAAGTVDVYVVNNDSGISNQVKYTYQGSKPKIDKIVPDQGKKQGKDNVEIYGSGFFSSEIEVYQGPALLNTLIMPLVRFGSITNNTIAREQPNSGRIDSGRATVNLDGGLKVEYNASEDNGKITVEIVEDGHTYQGIFSGYDGSIKYLDLTKLVNAAQTTTNYPGYELLRLQITDLRLLVERGYSPSTTLVRSTQITLKTPSYYGVGTVPVTVFNPDSGTAVGQYTYKNPDSNPSIINITKDGNSVVAENYEGKQVKIIRLTSKGGNIVSVIGQDFRENAAIQISNLLKIEPSAITYILPGRMTFTMPAVNKTEVGKLHRLIVINEDGASTASDEVDPPIYLQFIEGTTAPQIDTLTPNQGPSSGGTQVKMEGKDFRAGLNVYFGETPVAAQNVTVVDYKTVRVIAPPNSPGKKEVKIENPDGELSLPVDFTYISGPQVSAVVDPTDSTETSRITSISVEGGQEIKIKGSGFMAGGRVLFNPVIKKVAGETTSSNIIYLAGVPYTIESGTEGSDYKFIDGETITVKTPQGKVDTGGLIVINPDNGASDCYDNIIYGLPQLLSPIGVVAELVYDRYIKIHWTAVAGAKYYEVYTVLNNQPEFLDTTTGTNFMYSDLEPRTSYKFIVKTIGDFGSSKPSTVSNTVTTGKVTGSPDDDGSIEENTSLTKSGTSALAAIGADDNSKQVIIDLTRGTLAGCKELVISLPATVIDDEGPDIIVYGPDYWLQFNPRVFKAALMRNNRSEADAGIRFKISPYRGSIDMVGGNSLSVPYNLTADAFNGKSSSIINALASNMYLTMDIDSRKSSLRRLSTASLSRYNEYSNSWEQLNQVQSSQTTAITGVISRLGRYVVTGSRR